MIRSINWFSSEFSSSISLLESKEGKKEPKRDVRNAAAPPPTRTVAAAAAGSTFEDSRIEDKEDELFVGIATLDGGMVTEALLSIPEYHNERIIEWL